MADKTKRCVRASLNLLLALEMLFCITTAANAQNSPPAANQPSATGTAPRWPNPPDDITRREIAEMDQFLDNHPEVAEQLRKDPR